MNLVVNQEATPTEHDPRWTSVMQRDASADGAFVYAVSTTGVYCRPSCPSRRAKPVHVGFYPTPGEAEAAGYRACQRCNPNGRSSAQAHAAIVAEACRLIETAEAPPKLDRLVARFGMSPFHFHRQFKAIAGLTPKAYAAAHRAGKIRSGLADKTASVTGAIYAAGFNSSSRFYERSDAVLGMTPTAYRNGGKGADIRFAVGQCSLGAILVASK